MGYINSSLSLKRSISNFFENSDKKDLNSKIEKKVELKTITPEDEKKKNLPLIKEKPIEVIEIDVKKEDVKKKNLPLIEEKQIEVIEIDVKKEDSKHGNYELGASKKEKENEEIEKILDDYQKISIKEEEFNKEIDEETYFTNFVEPQLIKEEEDKKRFSNISKLTNSFRDCKTNLIKSNLGKIYQPPAFKQKLVITPTTKFYVNENYLKEVKIDNKVKFVQLVLNLYDRINNLKYFSSAVNRFLLEFSDNVNKSEIQESYVFIKFKKMLKKSGANGLFYDNEIRIETLKTNFKNFIELMFTKYLNQ